ncbi:hypothetical protein Vadar_029377 [Vaccinium darrowii]|uniref:Uncharacterized protein n=1 Tax=Vaccinium darrowii TaxID=229202 RepID=A0ACB7Z8G6_9ERIC|nr:hypothetical protein Vadar_029377 [Vaccinium darrowii]
MKSISLSVTSGSKSMICLFQEVSGFAGKLQIAKITGSGTNTKSWQIFCYACSRIGLERKGCKFVNCEEGQYSGYGPEMRTWRARKPLIPGAPLSKQATEAKGRLEELLQWRPKLPHREGFTGVTTTTARGNSFTWTNNQEGEANIRERLDRAMANVEWRRKFPKAQVFHDVIFGSDHCPLIIDLCVPLKKIPRLFKFESMWSTHQGCKDVIASAWNCLPPGSKMFSSADLQASPPFPNMGLQLKQFKDEIELLLDKEEMYFHQLSRIQWLNYGDRNTSFFQAIVIQRRQKNQLSRLKDDNGVWLNSKADINHHLGGFFSDLFHSSGQRDMAEALAATPQIISPAMNSDLICSVSDEEIEQALFQLGALKAPGPDGFPGFFYNTY